MAIKYNIEKLKSTIIDLCRLTGLSMMILDTKLNCLFEYQTRSDEYCKAVLFTAEGRNRCAHCDREMIMRASSNMLPVSHICHAGLCDSAVPIIKNGIVTGYVLIGRVRTRQSLSVEELDRLSAYGIPKETLCDYFARTTLLTEEQLGALKSLVSDILFENVIEIEYDDFIARATDYIDKNLSGDLSVARLTTALYVSKNFLYKSFKSYFGMTVNDYVTEQRIKRAERLLAETEAQASEIAEAVGIDSYTYFSKLFKRKRGISPQKYRAQIKSN